MRTQRVSLTFDITYDEFQAIELATDTLGENLRRQLLEGGSGTVGGRPISTDQVDAELQKFFYRKPEGVAPALGLSCLAHGAAQFGLRVANVEFNNVS